MLVLLVYFVDESVSVLIESRKFPKEYTPRRISVTEKYLFFPRLEFSGGEKIDFLYNNDFP